MTAIAGYWSFENSPDVERNCLQMLKGQTIYGQETAHGAYGPISMGRRIHRTLPEDRFDRTPITSIEGNILVADVRLDNREELAAALGIDARNECDAMVLAKALDRWEEGALSRLAGDFAFARWHPAKRMLMLARDISGQRPLHYHKATDFFAFASMPKGLQTLPPISRRANVAAVTAALIGVRDAQHSFFEGISSVRPGEIVIIRANGMDARRHWNPDLTPLRFSDQNECRGIARDA